MKQSVKRIRSTLEDLSLGKGHLLQDGLRLLRDLTEDHVLPVQIHATPRRTAGANGHMWRDVHGEEAGSVRYGIVFIGE